MEILKCLLPVLILILVLFLMIKWFKKETSLKTEVFVTLDMIPKVTTDDLLNEIESLKKKLSYYVTLPARVERLERMVNDMWNTGRNY
jgi:hypothetical protein